MKIKNKEKGNKYKLLKINIKKCKQIKLRIIQKTNKDKLKQLIVMQSYLNYKSYLIDFIFHSFIIFHRSQHHNKLQTWEETLR